nr:hypothetical protein GPGIFMOB_00451 [Acinetobacter gerneri]
MKRFVPMLMVGAIVFSAGVPLLTLQRIIQ